MLVDESQSHSADFGQLEFTYFTNNCEYVIIDYDRYSDFFSFRLLVF